MLLSHAGTGSSWGRGRGRAQRSLQAYLSSRTVMVRPSKSELLSFSMAASASSRVVKRTVPKPLGRGARGKAGSDAVSGGTDSLGAAAAAAGSGNAFVAPALAQPAT
jgi:hypothetical protein